MMYRRPTQDQCRGTYGM